jgi:vitamin B12/bleomycin/antimicrobial peptide transport system ATP-binding/permease protein
MALQRRWRVWLNDCVVDRWISHGHHYQLNHVRGDHANPEYRIADDVVATEAPVDFVSGTTRALLSALTFIAVLWTLGGALAQFIRDDDGRLRCARHSGRVDGGGCGEV